MASFHLLLELGSWVSWIGEESPIIWVAKILLLYGVNEKLGERLALSQCVCSCSECTQLPSIFYGPNWLGPPLQPIDINSVSLIYNDMPSDLTLSFRTEILLKPKWITCFKINLLFIYCLNFKHLLDMVIKYIIVFCQVQIFTEC